MVFLDRARTLLMAVPATQRGMACAIAYTLCAACSNAFIRALSAQMHPFEIVFFRSLIGLALFAPVMVRNRLAPLKSQQLGLQLLRGVVLGIAMLLFFLGLSLAPLAKVAALAFTLPLFASVFAVAILGEAIGSRRATALALGVVGSLLIVRPGWRALDPGAGVVLVSAAFAALSFVMVKTLSRTDSSVTTTLIGVLVALPVALVATVPFWTTPTVDQAVPLLAIGVLNIASHLFLAQAIKEIDVALVTPFDFLKFLWAVLIGFLAFGEVPDIWIWIGGTVIFVAATYIVYRER